MTRLTPLLLALALVAAPAGCEGRKPAAKPPPKGPPQLIRPAPKPDLPKPPPLAADGTWPASREGLLFKFETADQPATAFDPSGAPIPGYRVFLGQLEARDLAIVDPFGRLRVERGSFIAGRVGTFLSATVRQMNALSVEAVIEPADLTGRTPVEILWFGPGGEDRNFSLAQDGNQVVFYLRTSGAAEKRGGTDVGLFKLTDTRPVHVAVTYKSGSLVAYKNGERVFETSAVTGDFGNWTDGSLIVGDGPEKTRDWPGTIEDIAIYSRAIGDEEARLNSDACFATAAKRPTPPALIVRAKLIARSTTPSYHQVAPHWQGLADCLYEVEAVIQGECKSKGIVVSHWTLLDKRRLPFVDAPLGRTYELTLLPIGDNPFLLDVPRFDDLEQQVGPGVYDLPVYYDAGNLALEWQP